MSDFGKILESFLRTSPVQNFAKSYHSRQGQPFFDYQYRQLTADEISQLQAQGCTATNWQEVWITDEVDLKQLRNTHFIGICRLASPTKDASPADSKIPPGFNQVTLQNCEIAASCRIHQVTLLADTLVAEGVGLLGVGRCTRESTEYPFGNGLTLPLGIETGGRDVQVFAEINLTLAEQLARTGGGASIHQLYRDFLDRYLKELQDLPNFIGAYSTVMQTPVLENVYLGPGTLIDNAAYVRNATLVGDQQEPVKITDGAGVIDSLLQWGCEVTTFGLVDRAVMTEHSHVERHGKLTDSLLGPNSGVAEGEVTAALVGPFVGFHHQSLLIAAFWPEGKGNVGYGANVGSNHTAKAPDQEIWPGEGTFFGLGCNIKFPADYTESPYSIIATGVTTLPQKVSMPFSLINTPSRTFPDVSPAYNEIFPGWVLANNLYMLRRNEGKYRKRNLARRSRFTFEILRPAIIEKMQRARSALAAIKDVKDYYTNRDIPALGKNVLLEEQRLTGIRTYDYFMRYYALRGLQRELEAGRDFDQLMTQPPHSMRWKQEREILLSAYPTPHPVELLEALSIMLTETAQKVEQSKAKDDRRGARIIPDYQEVHPAASEDGFVQETWRWTKVELEKLKKLKERFRG